MAPGHPFYKEIEYVADAGVVTGYLDDNTYRPTNAISRQAAAAMFYRQLNGSLCCIYLPD